MKQDREIRQHITAAKGWLSRAEDSLEQENAIQGDLKLMLAQAAHGYVIDRDELCIGLCIGSGGDNLCPAVRG